MKIINDYEIKHTHLSHVVSSDCMRPVMTGIYFDLVNSCIVATNSHILMVAPISIEGNDEEKKLNPDELVKLLKSQSKIVPLEFFDRRKYMGEPKYYAFQIHYDLSDEKYARVFNGPEEVFKCKYIDGNFPDYTAVIPNGFDSVEEMSFDFDMVGKVHKSIPFKDKRLTLKFYAVNRAVRFESIHEPKFHGVIMPIIKP